MNIRYWLAAVFLGFLATLSAGCGAAYRSYSGCGVDCHYCTPAPLPYGHYRGCACHSCQAARYLAEQTPPPAPEAPAPR